MYKCQFSETQFSFCFTFEYIKQFFPIIPLPIFPNTVEEGRAGGGYDVEINGNIFFQFKIPVYHNLVSNFFRKHWKVFNHDYYKIKLETDGNQYKLLKDLLIPGNEVYYATPDFYTNNDLLTHYSNYEIVVNSGIFSLDVLPEHGSGKHVLIYSPHHNYGQIFSEPQRIKKITNINPLELFPRKLNGITIYKQAISIREILKQQKNYENFQLEKEETPERLVKKIHSVLLTHFNVFWYPVIAFN